MSQTNRGDLHAPSHAPEIPSHMLEEEEEADGIHPTVEDQLLQDDTEPEISITEVN